MNHKQQAVLFKRLYVLKDGRKKHSWWYYIYDEKGRRKRFSLNTTSKTEARAIIQEKIAAGTLLPKHDSAVPFKAFAEGFWDWDSSTYIKNKRLRGERITQTS